MKVNSEIIVRAGLDLLNEIGLEQLTLRRLAAELDIQAPTLYWHFKCKEELINAMATLILAEDASKLIPAKRPADWKIWVRTFGQGLRNVLLKYRDGARVVAGSRLTDTRYMETTEVIGSRLIEAGFSTREAVVLLSTIIRSLSVLLSKNRLSFRFRASVPPDMTSRSGMLGWMQRDFL